MKTHTNQPLVDGTGWLMGLRKNNSEGIPLDKRTAELENNGNCLRKVESERRVLRPVQRFLPGTARLLPWHLPAGRVAWPLLRQGPPAQCSRRIAAFHTNSMFSAGKKIRHGVQEKACTANFRIGLCKGSPLSLIHI